LDGSQRTCVDRMCRDMVDARTPEDILRAIHDANSDQEAIAAAQPEDVDAGELSRLQQLIARPGESGGVLTRTEFTVSKFCTEEKLKKRTSDRLLAMLKRRDFVIDEGILADLGFKNLQYLWFEYREVNGERVFGPANGAIWWQITVRQIGSGHVLIALVIFQDGSWVRMNLTCEPLYGELDCSGL